MRTYDGLTHRNVVRDAMADTSFVADKDAFVQLGRRFSTLILDVYGDLVNLRVSPRVLYHGPENLETSYEALPKGYAFDTKQALANDYVDTAGRYVFDVTGADVLYVPVTDYVDGVVTVAATLLCEQLSSGAVTVSSSDAKPISVKCAFELRGTAADKPLASGVPVGTTYWSVDSDPNLETLEVSDGTNWVVV